MIHAEVFVVEATSPDGGKVRTLFARGDDGSLWMEAAYLEVSPAELAKFRRKRPGMVQTEPRSGRVFVEVGTFMAECESTDRAIEVMRLAGEHLEAVERVKPSFWDL